MERELLNDQLGKVRAREKSVARDERGLAGRSAKLARDEEELAGRSAKLARDEKGLRIGLERLRVAQEELDTQKTSRKEAEWEYKRREEIGQLPQGATGRELRYKKVESDPKSGRGADVPIKEEKTAPSPVKVEARWTLPTGGQEIKAEQGGGCPGFYDTDANAPASLWRALRGNLDTLTEAELQGCASRVALKEDLEGVFGKESDKIILGVIQWHSGKRVMSVINCDGQVDFNHSFCTRCGAAKECFRQKVKAKLRSG
ncbi:hypothetical protein B484DRAFT_410359 [Ochromonadaceae sp. CCMP2298]|nr:hypothetical protein B484DRAFT_410359 [Ochromonadaceae sp. CCMP2298]